MISPGKYQKVKNINLFVSLEGTLDDNRDPNKTVFRVKSQGSNLVGTDIMKQLTNYRVKFQNAPGAQDQPINL
jgi:hypothetical protein